MPIYLPDEAERIRRMTRPSKMVDVVLDTDTFNEIDDQYALAYLIQSDEKLRLQAIYAAPFFNHHSESPKDGMERSYEEIHHILNLMGREDYWKVTCKGSTDYLPSETEPVDSPAARDLVERALAHGPDNLLYVVAIGAITNVASAILMCPEIVEHMVVVWLGGNSLDWKDNHEFNCFQDVAAARVVFGSRVPLIQLPCMGVVSSFTTTGPELEYWLKGKNSFCDYMVDKTADEARIWTDKRTWSRPIWDVTAVAWLLDEAFMEERLVPCPIPEYDDKWGFDPTRHFMKYVYWINRDVLLDDLFGKLEKIGRQNG